MKFSKDHIKMKVLDFATAKEFIVKNHYSHSMPVTNLTLGFYLYGVLNCVIVFGQSATYRMAASLPSPNYWELTRLFSFDWGGEQIESYCIAQALKYIEKNCNKDILVSFADPSQGHVGYVYQATNWLYCGLTDRAGNTLYRIDGMLYHPRTFCKRFGVTSGKKLLEILQREYPNSVIKREQYARKHRYIYLFGSHKQKKELLLKLKYPILPYPKLSGEVSRVIRPTSSGKGPVRFRQPAL